MLIASCIAAGPATATTLVQAERFPSEVTGEDTTTDHVFIGEDEYKVTCKSTKFTGELKAPSETLVVTPVYSECTAILGLVSATVAMNGCKYELVGGEESSENHFHGKLGIACPGEKQIAITSGPCEVQIPSQTAHGEVEFTNEGFESTQFLGVHWAVTELKYTKTNDTSFCPLTGKGVKTDGKYQGDGKMQGQQGGKPDEMAMGKEVETTLCEEEVKTKCKKKHGPKTLIKFDNPTGVSLEFVGNATEIECSASEAWMWNEVESGVTMKLEQFSLTFGGCQLAAPGKEGCPNVVKKNAPVTTLTPSTLGTGNGILQTAVTLFLECQGNTITCEYEAKQVVGLFKGGFPADAVFAGQIFTKKALGGGMKEVGCSNQLMWNTQFVVREPTPVYVTQP